MRGCWILLLLLLLSLLAVRSLAAETTEERFVSGLVARRLFSLAELACQNHLADPSLSQREQAAWTVELIRILGQHAAHSLPNEQAARWQVVPPDGPDFPRTASTTLAQDSHRVTGRADLPGSRRIGAS